MTIEIGLLIAAASLLIGYFSYALNRSKEIKTEGRQGAETNAKLEYISKGVDDIRIDLKANERQMIVLGERITRVEESTKGAHKRLDNVEKEMN
ncbi:hypothetical protein MNO09_17410 [Bacillus sp. N5-665]|uniref:Hypothetical secreted or membrane protein n=1 Tax=Bacillus wiedmannii TaxID=1890302 RepID=A0AB37YTT5_9BACI|nr:MULTISPECIES: hypothetical protein [Bacillus]PEJ40052.1 hypothetical protein CN889_18045 [Bacillus wiedmannii]UNK31267.1 hypothetical protein MNO09_17410 [Bacillus sp. N5-665]SCC45810.1 Hypothetical secreted or membrane protein [Bacillus wiedmannii]